MPLKIEKPYLDWAPLVPMIAGTLQRQTARQQETPNLSRISVVGPVPLYRGRAAEFIHGGVETLHAVGWRGLLLSSDHEPCGYVDIFDTNEREVYPDYIVRGKESARALAAAFSKAERVATTLVDDLSIRVVTFWPWFVTALWMKGKEDLYIPTRAGRGSRPELQAVSATEFVKLLEGIMERQSSSTVRGQLVQKDS